MVGTELFAWRDQYSVGIPQIDNQHKGLIAIINKLHAAMLDGKGKDVLAGVLDELVRYTEYHFAFEEELLQKRGYSALTEHRLEHRRLTKQVMDLRDQYRSGKLTITMEVKLFLKNWLANHILEQDLHYAAELAKATPTR